MNNTTVIIFSKDRPWQLQQWLRSFMIMNINTTKPSIIIHFDASNDEYAEHYSKVITKFQHDHPTIDITLTTGDFSKVLIKNISWSKDQVLLSVDDWLWTRPFEIVNLNQLEVDIFSYRLGKNITYCQPANCASKAPNFTYIDSNKTKFKFVGTGDWAYSFDISASLYNKNFLLSLCIMAAHHGISIKNPNEFEAAGNILNFFGRATASCYEISVGNTITVNRVQDQFPNPLAGKEVSTEECLYLLDSDMNYDLQKYGLRMYPQIHIGDFFLEST